MEIISRPCLEGPTSMAVSSTGIFVSGAAICFTRCARNSITRPRPAKARASSSGTVFPLVDDAPARLRASSVDPAKLRQRFKDGGVLFDSPNEMVPATAQNVQWFNPVSSKSR